MTDQLRLFTVVELHERKFGNLDNSGSISAPVCSPERKTLLKIDSKKPDN